MRAALLVEQSRSAADLANVARLLSSRLGAATADRLARVLATKADPECLAEVGEAIVRCATGEDLLREAGVFT